MLNNSLTLTSCSYKMSIHPLPNKLEEDLKNVPKYKPQPFNINELLESQENHIFDEVFGSVIKKNANPRDINETSTTTRTKDFTTLLASKLANTEEENKELRNKLANSQVKIMRLEETVTELKDIVKKQTTTSELNVIQCIRHENSQLQKQLMEMEQFLADYGLYWVGYNDSVQEEEEEDCQQEDDQEEMQHFDLFLKKVDELNSLIRDEPTRVVTSSNGGGVKARLAHMSGKSRSEQYMMFIIDIYILMMMMLSLLQNMLRISR